MTSKMYKLYTLKLYHLIYTNVNNEAELFCLHHHLFFPLSLHHVSPKAPAPYASSLALFLTFIIPKSPQRCSAYRIPWLFFFLHLLIFIQHSPPIHFSPHTPPVLPGCPITTHSPRSLMECLQSPSHLFNSPHGTCALPASQHSTY